jgi:hypothetical protein
MHVCSQSFGAHCTYHTNYNYIQRPDESIGLPPRFKRILPSSGLLRDVRWFKTDVSGLLISPTFKGSSKTDVSGLPIGRLPLEDGANRF